jgi:hypothetical protein
MLIQKDGIIPLQEKVRVRDDPLVAGCEMDFVTSVGAVALACPGVDYMRVWPLPVVQPWEGTPDPIEGWMAERGGTVLAASRGYPLAVMRFQVLYLYPGVAHNESPAD